MIYTYPVQKRFKINEVLNDFFAIPQGFIQNDKLTTVAE